MWVDLERSPSLELLVIAPPTHDRTGFLFLACFGGVIPNIPSSVISVVQLSQQGEHLLMSSVYTSLYKIPHHLWTCGIVSFYDDVTHLGNT